MVMKLPRTITACVVDDDPEYPEGLTASRGRVFAGMRSPGRKTKVGVYKLVEVRELPPLKVAGRILL